MGKKNPKLRKSDALKIRQTPDLEELVSIIRKFLIALENKSGRPVIRDRLFHNFEASKSVAHKIRQS